MRLTGETRASHPEAGQAVPGLGSLVAQSSPRVLNVRAGPETITLVGNRSVEKDETPQHTCSLLRAFKADSGAKCSSFL